MLNLQTYSTRKEASDYCDTNGQFGGQYSYWQNVDGTWSSCKYVPNDTVRKFWTVRGVTNHTDRDARVMTDHNGCTWFV